MTFLPVEGRASATLAGREIVADAAMAADEGFAARVRAERNWRRDYVPALRELTALAGDGPTAASVARRGLDAIETHLVFEHEGSPTPLTAAGSALPPLRKVGTGTVRGLGPPARSLRIPYRGSELEGPSLDDQLARWVWNGQMEPTVAERVQKVGANPEWLALPGRRVVLVGAGSEVGPFEPLCSWGAEVLAIDLPGGHWERILSIAENGAGVVHVPLDGGGSPGLDLTRELPEAREWIAPHADQATLVLGMYAYADGARHVLVTAAFDALARALVAEDDRTALSFLATPTDTFIVPAAAVAQARGRYAARRLRRLAQLPAQVLSGGRLFQPAYGDGQPIADALVPQQGPNYALAKRLQRWRGVVAAAEGTPLSFNVAPATWTRSVTRNRVLAAAYAGARRFGVEIFAPETTRALMAALLVYDMNQPPAPRRRPELIFCEGAAHGGLWRAAYEPRSVLGLAALAGVSRAFRPA